MYKNARASHTVQPVLSQFLRQSQLFTIMHRDEPVFILLPWSLYTALRLLLTQHGYTDAQLLETHMIGISQLARRFLSFQKLEATFHVEQGGDCALVVILKQNNAVGALIRYDYYLRLIAFLQEQQISGLEPFLTEVPDALQLQERLLTLTAFRNLAMQLPSHFDREKHESGGDLPFIITRQYQPVPMLVVLSWEIWKRLLDRLTDTGSSQEDDELFDRLLLQRIQVEKDLALEPAL